MAYKRCPQDYGIFLKKLPCKSIIIITIYVDDGRVRNDTTNEARIIATEDKKRLQERFEMKFKKPEYFLGVNIIRHSAFHYTLHSGTYIEAMIEKYLSEPLESYPNAWSENPCDKTIYGAYRSALTQRMVPASKELIERYGAIVGAIGFISPNTRPDISFPTGICLRCTTFPTEDMYMHAIRILVYLGRNHLMGLNIHAAPNREIILITKVDSTWDSLPSTTGFTVQFNGTSIAHGSRRQQNITMSSTEAELNALCTGCLETLHYKSMFEFLGAEFVDPIPIWIDNKGAYDLMFRDTPGQSTKHVERKIFKGRELRGLGIIIPTKVDTEINDSDMFTKALDTKKFQSCCYEFAGTEQTYTYKRRHDTIR